MNQDSERPFLLVINSGSSTIRFARYAFGPTLHRGLSGKIDRIGLSDGTLRYRTSVTSDEERKAFNAKNSSAAAQSLMDWLETQNAFAGVTAIGHRVVHGMSHPACERITAPLMDELQRISPQDPEHMPLALDLIGRSRERHPHLPQFACFDTAFHQTMPRVASQLAIPRCYQAEGVRRYGFHGLSYTYLMEELVRLGDSAATHGRVILAHLGNGASMAAILDGRSIDTSMGFTPTGGLVMSTRSGDLDPSLADYFSQSKQMTAAQFQRMVNHESGLLGISETSSDLRDLLPLESSDTRAAEAVAMFCYQARKWIGSYAAALGGLDSLVFAGGIGENNALIRKRICESLGFLGIEIDEVKNEGGLPLISSESSRVKVRVIRTDEEQMIARLILRAMKPKLPSPEFSFSNDQERSPLDPLLGRDPQLTNPSSTPLAKS